MDKVKKEANEEIWVNAFNEESAQEFRSELLAASAADISAPIVVYIDSYGGFVDSLAKMIEAMDEVPNPIITVTHGKAMSCGAVLLSHGDIRFCGKHSRVMIHETSSGTQGDVHDVKADAKEADRLNRWFMGLLAENCNIKGGYEALRKMIKDQDGRDRYLNAEESLAFGIVDVIGTPDVQSRVVYDVGVKPPKTKLVKVQPSKTKKIKKGKIKKK